MWGKLDELNKKFKDIKKHERAGEKNVSYNCLIETGFVPESTKMFIYFCWLWTDLVKRNFCLKHKSYICPEPAMMVYPLLLTLDRYGKKPWVKCIYYKCFNFFLFLII